jgi:CRP-like cAMP-binding protein
MATKVRNILNYTILKKVKLFQGLSEQELESVLKCLNAKAHIYKKDSIITLNGDKVKDVGVIMSGSIMIIKEDAAGRQNILAHLSESDTFGEVFACAGIKKSPVTVTASAESEVLFVEYRRLITTCNSSCVFHAKIIQNMLQLIAQKSLELNKKIDYLIINSMRQKLVMYMLEQYDIHQNNNFEIPLNRSELADFLNVDRSAMSRELSRMRNDGLVTFCKNKFTLLNLQMLKDYTLFIK